MASRPCLFRGEQAGSIVILCCGGKERLDPVYSCLHDKKTIKYASESIPSDGVANVEIDGTRKAAKVAACQTCDLKLVAINPRSLPIVKSDVPKNATQIAIEQMRAKRWPSSPGQRAVVYDCNNYGIGDALIAAWIAEGTKTDVGHGPQLVLCASNERKLLLETFGQTIHYPVAPNQKTGMGGEYVNKPMEYGTPPRVLVRAKTLGISSIPVRPPYTPSDELRQWSSRDENKSDVLLCPHATCGSRRWPEPKWKELNDRLVAQGLKVQMLGHDMTSLRQLPTWRAGLSMLQLIGMIDSARLVIGNDSGPINVAGTLDKTSICIFGKTSDVAFSHTPSVRCVQAEKRLVQCAGCWSGWGYDSAVCEKSCKALESITVDSVYKLAMELLQ